jgi:hypothetical protein
VSEGLLWIIYAEIVLVFAVVADLLMSARVVRKR